MPLHLFIAMRQQFLGIIIFIFCVNLPNAFMAQSSVQLPGGVQFKDTEVDLPYVLNPNEDVNLIIKQNIYYQLSVIHYPLFNFLESPMKLSTPRR